MVNPSVPDLAIFAGMLVGFYSIARVMLNAANKEREADRAERLRLADAITLMASNSSKVARATERSANEAKERNGHLAELVVQNTDSIVKAVTDHYDQHIRTQKVDKQVIKKG
jgi:hypothetical protein